jgi:cell division protein FtsW (lipid II flippase)
MFKYLIIFVLIGLLLIFTGNYYDLQRNKINRKEYNRRNRFFIVLVFIVIAILLYIRKR